MKLQGRLFCSPTAKNNTRLSNFKKEREGKKKENKSLGHGEEEGVSRT